MSLRAVLDFFNGSHKLLTLHDLARVERNKILEHMFSLIVMRGKSSLKPNKLPKTGLKSVQASLNKKINICINVFNILIYIYIWL